MKCNGQQWYTLGASGFSCAVSGLGQKTSGTSGTSANEVTTTMGFCYKKYMHGRFVGTLKMTVTTRRFVYKGNDQGNAVTYLRTIRPF